MLCFLYDLVTFGIKRKRNRNYLMELGPTPLRHKSVGVCNLFIFNISFFFTFEMEFGAPIDNF